VNWLTFSSAFILGFIQLRGLWPLREGIYAADNIEFMAFLVTSFMWITAFRAFALRTVRDLVETILPCGSIILLTLVIRPNSAALASVALVVLGALALLAAEHKVFSRRDHYPVAALTHTQSSRRAGAFYSWPTLYAVVLIGAVLMAYVAARSELSGGWGDYLRYTLARQVLAWMAPHDNYVMPDTAVSLARLSSWPESDRPVFRVESKFPGNYRLGAYHTYTGIWWRTDSHTTEIAVGRGDTWQIPLSGSGASRTSANRVEQSFTAYKGLVSLLPSLFVPVEVQVQQLRVRYDPDYCLRIPRFVRRGQSFKVISYIQPVLPLKRAGVEFPQELLEKDLQLPDTLPTRVRELAVSLTKDARNPYEKARAIEQHLMWNYRYTLQAPSGYPQDFVDHFLFTSKRGFCHHFAGSMVIMCRAIGLPARLASGYLRGEEVEGQTDVYIVREKDAHVWPEVYFRGAGWIAFEPTPAAEEETGAFAAVWKQITTSARTNGLALYGVLRRNWLSFVVGALGLALLILAVVWQVRGRYLRAYRGNEPGARVVRAYLRMRRALVQRGAPDDPTLAPREFVAAMPDNLQYLREAYGLVTEKYLVARYGPVTPSPETVAGVDRAYADFRAKLRRRPRAR
ncbi:MAG: transglutaminase domain-containing protein, partial [Armatimonadia bacterium]